MKRLDRLRLQQKAAKSSRKGVDTVLRVFRDKRFIYLHDPRYNKIIEMQNFV